MKLVSTSSDSYVVKAAPLGGIEPIKLLEIVSSRITQILSSEAEIGGINPRGDSFRAIPVSDPIVIISIKEISTVNGSSTGDLLNQLQITSSITTFDTYAKGTGSTRGRNIAVQGDEYNLDSQVLATQGRLYYDLRKYATSEITLRMVNRAPVDRIFRIKMEVYSKRENIHYQSTDNRSESSMKAKFRNTENANVRKIQAVKSREKK